MTLVFFVSICTFLFFYFACLISTTIKQKMFFTGGFIVFSTLLRVLINVNLNNDYYYYYNFDIFNKPTSFLSYLINEPYLYSVYAFFSFFIEDKKDIFQAMYWFNFFIDTAFFVWLLFRKDVQMWKKMLLFTLHYFVFGYVVLRNGPAYILFALYFYYALRNKKFNLVWLTPFMHISSCLILVTYFHKWRYYFKALILVPIVLILFFLFLKPFLASVHDFDRILSKISIYLEGVSINSVMHVSYFLFIQVLTFFGFLFYKRKMLHPILVTTLFIYGTAFLISPVVAHRFTPYVLFAMLFFPFDETEYAKTMRILNRFSVLLLPIFIYTLLNTHKANLYIDSFMK